MNNQKLTQHLWLNCYAKFFCGRLFLKATIHRRDGDEVESKPVYEFLTVMTHSDDEPVRDVVKTSLYENAPLLVAIEREYTAEVLRDELRTSLEDYYSGGAGELPVHVQYGQTTHHRDLEPLSW